MTKIEPTAPTKTCSSCGQKKPLSAFLLLSANQGNLYGNICSSCRKTQATKAPSKDTEESTTSHSTHGISGKEKIKSDLDKKQEREHRKDLEEEEREKTEDLRDIKIEKIASTHKEATKHRENYLQSMFDKKSQPAATEGAAQSFEDKLTQEARIDLATGPAADTYFGEKVKHQSSVFRQFKNWLGNAPIVSNVERAIKTGQLTVPAERTSITDNEKPSDIKEYNQNGPGNSKKR